MLRNIHDAVITTQTNSSGGLQIYFCMIFYETRHHAQAQVTFGALINHALALTITWTKMAAKFAGFCWPLSVMAAVKLHNICYGLIWLSNQSGLGQSWLLPASLIKFLTRESLKSHWVYLGQHEGNRIQKLSVVKSRRRKNIAIHLKLHKIIKNLLAIWSELLA